MTLISVCKHHPSWPLYENVWRLEGKYCQDLLFWDTYNVLVPNTILKGSGDNRIPLKHTFDAVFGQSTGSSIVHEWWIQYGLKLIIWVAKWKIIKVITIYYGVPLHSRMLNILPWSRGRVAFTMQQNVPKCSAVYWHDLNLSRGFRIQPVHSSI